ncbi:glycosyltransferase family 2 protein [Geobacter argillaceus]|uniref:glycosyltransferase family 2 protein n=1 Tax=Geobacter argillaceus TaxID=345631 RepID=UPI001FE28349|nr:glycosyltransferase family 2 protein [Geobacter argillaceus]
MIILNWNGRQYLDDCLGSLADQTFRDFETILVDNGSTDGSAAYVRERFPWVRLVELPENVGFTGGNDQGLRAAAGEFIVTLNNDTKADPGFLEELLRPALADPRIGMVAAKMLNFYDPGRIDSVGVKVAGNGLGYNIGVGEEDGGQYDEPAEVFGPCAGAALYRRVMLDQVGFFDPEFFAYYEDLDLAWRGRLAGWRCVTAPGAVVYHVHSATSGKMSPFTVYQVQRNKWFTLIKNWPASLILRQLPWIISFDLGALVLALLRGRGWSALRARADVLRSLPRLLARRRAVQAGRRLTTAEIARFLVPADRALSTFARKVAER